MAACSFRVSTLELQPGELAMEGGELLWVRLWSLLRVQALLGLAYPALELCQVEAFGSVAREACLDAQWPFRSMLVGRGAGRGV